MCVKSKREKVFQAIEQLQVLSHTFLKKRRELAGEVGLTEAQWRVLDEIAQEDFMPSLFAIKLDQSKAAVSKILRQLVDRKLVTVETSEGDARFRTYQLTDQSFALLEELKRSRADAIDHIWMSINEGLLDHSIEFSRKLLGKFSDYEIKTKRTDPRG